MTARYRQKYAIAKGLGERSGACMRAAGKHEEWLALLGRHGIDPAVYGDLSVKLPGGKRCKYPERGRRYRALRGRGLSSRLSSHFSATPNLYEFACQRLDRGVELHVPAPRRPFDRVEAAVVLASAPTVGQAAVTLGVELKTLWNNARRYRELMPLALGAKARGRQTSNAQLRRGSRAA